MYYQQPQPDPATAYRVQMLQEKLAEIDKGIERLERLERCRESYERAEVLIADQRATGSPLAWYSQQRLKLAR